MRGEAVKTETGSAGTYRATDTHLQEEDDLLPWREGAEVDGRESTDSDCTDAVVEGVDVANLEFSVGCVEYARGYKGGEGAASSGVSQSVDE